MLLLEFMKKDLHYVESLQQQQEKHRSIKKPCII